ncbi:FAD binding domain-containing protein [Daedaleopsis nitida]|nr:FAD binding domain-containing protein [Daedaleopsis nitida]
MSQLASSIAPVKESYVDVLIIGAGPAGVMCANALQQAGVSVRIVDKRPVGLAAGQADGCQPRTLEIMQSYGLADKLFKRGEMISKSVFYNPGHNGGIVRTASSGAINAETARWHFGVMLHQGGIEDVFLESMSEQGLEVERSTIPTSLKLSDTRAALDHANSYVATVTLDHLDRVENSTEIVHAKYVLGSDGAHSWTRKALGIDMEGDATGAHSLASCLHSVWGVIDIVPDTDLPDYRCQCFINSAAGRLIIIPRENNLIRLYIQQLSTTELIDPATGRADKSRTSPEKLLRLAQKIIHPYRIAIKDGHISWWTLYTVGQRVATKYSIADRAFIAGDACHTHSPKAGQGLNASMGDTHNLAWKLAYILRSWADMSLLRTYESERRTYAQTLIEFDKKWSKLVAGRPRTEAEENQDGATHEEFIGRVMFTTFGGFTSGVGIRYNSSMIVAAQYQAVASKLIVGERMIPQLFVRAADMCSIELQDLLPADTRFKILVFAGDVSIDSELAQLQKIAEELERPESFLRRFGRGDNGSWKVFDVLCFSSAKQHDVDLFRFPALFRHHWAKVLLDDVDIHGISGGGGYKKYGIDEHAGAMVIVRPDGYVGMVAPLDAMPSINSYFSRFLI